METDVDRLHRTREFFGVRAATWDTKFGEDGPAYARATREAGFRPGGAVLDVGCGTGRAVSGLRAAVGPAGLVLGLDATPEMLMVAAGRGAPLLLGDACHLPVASDSLDGIFAAGLLNHLPDPAATLREFARVVRPGGRLVLFHPIGRAALAARHGHELRPDEPLAETSLRASTATTGWTLDAYDDAPTRFYATATRTPGVKP